MNLYRLGYALGTLARPIVNVLFPPRPRSLDARLATVPRDWPAPPADLTPYIEQASRAAADVAEWMALPDDYDPVAVWRELDDRNLADRLNEWETQA